MGANNGTYLAVLSKNRLQVLESLSLKGTGTHEDVPESPVLGSDLGNGWYLVLANEYDSDLLGEQVLGQLSVDAQVITCMIEEHCMHSFAAGWRHGQQIWSVFHKGTFPFRRTEIDSLSLSWVLRTGAETTENFTCLKHLLLPTESSRS